MTRRSVLGFALGAAVLAAAVVPATADADEDAPAPAEAVTVQTIDPAALEGQPTSSDGQVGTGETDPSSLSLPPVPGAPEPQIIIGNDGRTPVTDTTGFPARAVAQIFVDPFDPSYGSFSCTGWFISADAIATAAHCIEYDNEGAVYTVIPGRDGATTPFPSCSSLEIGGATSTNSWVTQNDGTQRPPTGPAKDDYAALNLDQDLCPDYNDLGYFGFRQVTDPKIKGLEQTLAGYPADKMNEQWESTGKIRRANRNLVFYKNDTKPGNSGSPVYKEFNNCGTCAVAIHTSSYEFATPQENGGTRIRAKVGQFLNTVKNQP